MEAITVEKGVSVSANSYPLDVSVLEVEIDKLKAEMCNLKDMIEKNGCECVKYRATTCIQ